MTRITDLQTLDIHLLNVPREVRERIASQALTLGNHYRHKLGMSPDHAMKSAWNQIKRMTNLERRS
jgi:hypothetical protein